MFMSTIVIIKVGQSWHIIDITTFSRKSLKIKIKMLLRDNSTKKKTDLKPLNKGITIK